MAHDFSELFAELGDAKAQLQRSSRKARALIDGQRASLEAHAHPEPDKALFGWRGPTQR
jgi:hypothetical protein